MANASAFGFGAWDALGSYGEYALSAHAARETAALQYKYAKKYAKSMPSWTRQGLESAGYNPILAVNSGSASPTLTTARIDSPSVDGPSFDQTEMERKRNLRLQRQVMSAEIASKNSASAVNRAQEGYIKAITERSRYIPINEQDSGGVSLFGTGFNFGGTDTLFFDTSTGEVVRPKNNSMKNSARSISPSDKPSVRPSALNSFPKGRRHN